MFLCKIYDEFCAVFECQRAGLKGAAMEYARLLVQPEHRNEYRSKINPQHQKKIDKFVRQRRGVSGIVDDEEAVTPCPFCQAPVKDTILTCDACKNTIPFCIFSVASSFTIV